MPKLRKYCPLLWLGWKLRCFALWFTLIASVEIEIWCKETRVVVMPYLRLLKTNTYLHMSTYMDQTSQCFIQDCRYFCNNCSMFRWYFTVIIQKSPITCIISISCCVFFMYVRHYIQLSLFLIQNTKDKRHKIYTTVYYSKWNCSYFLRWSDLLCWEF